jgi:aromatic ring-opening dioxygenase catalytic subunit (LigB family)
MKFRNLTTSFLSAAKLLQQPLFSSNSSMARAPVISVCHGGGPMPLLNDPGHKDLIQSMTTKLPKVLGLGTDAAPKAIVLVTAHWSERVPTISSGKTPKLLYDFGGFPPESYQIKYDAPGSPEVAKLVADTLRGAGFQPELNEERGMYLGPKLIPAINNY